MGWLRRLGFAFTAAVAYCGGGPSPDTDAERVARIDEMYAGYRKEFPEVPSVTAEVALAQLKAGQAPVFVDARTEAGRAVSVLPGAVAAEAVEADPGAYRGKELVVYCTIGYRSGLWAERMAGRGLTVRNLEGSLLSWTHVGGPLVTPAGEPTTRVHVYGRPWDLASSAYQATY